MRLIATLILSAATVTAFASGEPEFSLAIEGHRFVPDRIEIPAGKKVKLLVQNRDATAEEFESEMLKVEKVIPGKGRAVIFVGPLPAGEYKFEGEYNARTAQGVVVAK